MTPYERLRAVLQELDTDDLRYLSSSLPTAVLESLAATLDAEDRSWVEQSLRYPDGSAARLMTQDALRLEGTQTAADAVAIVRALGALPSHTDRLFLVDSRNIFVGAGSLGVLLIADPAARIETVMEPDVRRFHLDDTAKQVATAFEPSDLLWAPVADERGKLIGRVTAHSVITSCGCRRRTKSSASQVCVKPRTWPRRCSIRRATAGPGGTRAGARPAQDRQPGSCCERD